jgi:hypothetical protein
VLKAKYFPSMSVLEARNTRNMSYTWRSLLKGVEVIKMGMIWRVGNGEEINIWSDPWLDREGSKRPVTPCSQNLVTKVVELISPVTGQWDIQLVMDIFSKEDDRVILSTPLRAEFEDFPAWFPDNKGIFTVRPVYKMLAKEVTSDSQGATVSGVAEGGMEFDWKLLWSQPCASKTKHFLWRLAHGNLPWKLNYARRGMDIDTKCLMCTRLNEDGGHIFLHCKMVRTVWRMLDLEAARVFLCNWIC